jgi:hypothetical protein
MNKHKHVEAFRSTNNIPSSLMGRERLIPILWRVLLSCTNAADLPDKDWLAI